MLVTAFAAVPAKALVNGELDRAGHYPAVVRLDLSGHGACTATKVGPLALLTAAHCVVDLRTGRIKPEFAPGQMVRITSTPSGTDTIHVVSAGVELPPAYKQGLARFVAYKEARSDTQALAGATAGLPTIADGLRIRHFFSARYPDVAILRLATPSPNIPAMAILQAEPPAGAEVILVGYGCRHLSALSQGAMSRADNARTWGKARVIRVDEPALYMEATQRATHAPSLCPGDSGGPVLYRGQVIGVLAVVHGLSPRHGARSNMATYLGAVSNWLSAR